MLNIWIKFLRYLKPFWKHQVLLFLLLMINNIAVLSSPFILKIFVDNVIPESNYNLLVILCAVLFGAYILRISTSFISDYMYTWIGNKVALSISTELFSHILRLPLSYFEQNPAGDLVYRIDKDVDQIQRALTGSLIVFVNNFIAAFVLIVLMCLLSWELFLTICLIYPLVALIMKLSNSRINTVANRIRHEQAELLNYFMERFLNVKLIKAFNGYVFEENKLLAKLNKLSDAYLTEVRYTSLSKNSSILLTSMVPVILLGVGGYKVVAGFLTLGTLIAFLQYASRLHDPLKSLVNLNVDIVKTSVSIQRIFDVMVRPVEDARSKSEQLDQSFRELEFREVHFSYSGKKILNGIDLKIESGKTLGLTGLSGSGKSTIVNLIVKFHKPTAGEILLNGCDLDNVPANAARSVFSLCCQDFLIFNDTITENIRYGNADINANSVKDILDITGLAGRVSGEDTENAGDRGNHLSGGQRQRVSVGRALLKKADVLILDEGTSEVDSITEEQILKSAIASGAFKSIIIVSHRISALKHLDDIVFLESGRVKESGTLNELIERKGSFYEAFKEQIEFEFERSKC